MCALLHAISCLRLARWSLPQNCTFEIERCESESLNGTDQWYEPLLGMDSSFVSPHPRMHPSLAET